MRKKKVTVTQHVYVTVSLLPLTYIINLQPLKYTATLTDYGLTQVNFYDDIIIIQ